MWHLSLCQPSSLKHFGVNLWLFAINLTPLNKKKTRQGTLSMPFTIYCSKYKAPTVKSNGRFQLDSRPSSTSPSPTPCPWSAPTEDTQSGFAQVSFALLCPLSIQNCYQREVKGLMLEIPGKWLQVLSCMSHWHCLAGFGLDSEDKKWIKNKLTNIVLVWSGTSPQFPMFKQKTRKLIWKWKSQKLFPRTLRISFLKWTHISWCLMTSCS